MLEGSQPLFEGSNFTIIPNGLSDEDRRQVPRRVPILARRKLICYTVN